MWQDGYASPDRVPMYDGRVGAGTGDSGTSRGGGEIGGGGGGGGHAQTAEGWRVKKTWADEITCAADVSPSVGAGEGWGAVGRARLQGTAQTRGGVVGGGAGDAREEEEEEDEEDAEVRLCREALARDRRRMAYARAHGKWWDEEQVGGEEETFGTGGGVAGAGDGGGWAGGEEAGGFVTEFDVADEDERPQAPGFKEQDEWCVFVRVG